MGAEQWRLHSLERHDRLAISVTMSATDEELQKLASLQSTVEKKKTYGTSGAL